MNVLIQSSVFAAWLDQLTDRVAKAKIARRVISAELGNFGDCGPVGEGVSEMRIDYGPGYRVYFKRTGSLVYLLLCGGNKSSQKRDIVLAKQMAGDLK